MTCVTALLIIAFIITLCCTAKLSYPLKTYGAGSSILVKLPGFELVDGFVHSDLPDFYPLLQRDELPLPRRFHPGVRVINRRWRLLYAIGWMGDT